MFNNFFNFFPVGQGLFYCGLLNGGEYSFVYDCGTEDKVSTLLPFINTLHKWNNGNKLNFVVISHFHEDHIKGIRELENIIGFKKVFIPYISNNAQITAFIIGFSIFANYDYQDNYENFEQKLSIFRYVLRFYTNENDYPSVVVSNSKVFIDYNWVFKLFNKTISAIEERDLLTEINKLLLKYKTTNIIDLFEIGKIKEIKAVYMKVFGKDLNRTSLMLLHYPYHIDYPHLVFYNPNNYGIAAGEKSKHHFYPYTLLTGDVKFDDQLATSVIHEYPTGISGIVQVPHHGSRDNWPSLLNKFPDFNCYVVNYGTTNKHGHPDYLLKTHVSNEKYFDNNEFIGFLYSIY